MEWSYNIVDRSVFGQRSGMEFFPEDGNYVYTIAQFFPRMCVYDDYEGWQNKQFLGRGEFTLPFGDYKVRITTPADHIVGATGILKNPTEVLSKAESERFEKAKTSFDKPVIIVTQAEASSKEKKQSRRKRKRGNFMLRMYGILRLLVHANLSGMHRRLSLVAKLRWPCRFIRRKEIRSGRRNRRKQLKIHLKFIQNTRSIILIRLPSLFTPPASEWSIR